MEPRVPSSCSQWVDLLPWLINGTLGGAEREAVLRHLDECPDCRRERGQLWDAAIADGLHPDPEALTAFVLRSMEPARLAAVEQHLVRCGQCSELTSMAHEGLDRVRAIHDGGVRFDWRPAVAAAAGMAAGWWLALFWVNAGRLETKLKSAERQIESLNAGKAELSRRLELALEPRVNVVVVDLFPASFARRSGRTEGVPALLPVAPDAIALVLNSQAAPREGPFGARLFDSRGNLVWKSAPLVRQSQREFTIQFPPGFPAPGDYELRLVQGEREEVLEVYVFRK